MNRHHHAFRFALCSLLIVGSPIAPVHADLTRTEIRQAQKELQAAIRDEHADGFLAPFELLLENEDRRTVRYVVEAYTPDQIGRGTGGPPDPALTPTLAQLREELDGLDFVIGRELEREIHEGRHHDGVSAVVQVLAVKPGS